MTDDEYAAVALSLPEPLCLASAPGVAKPMSLGGARGVDTRSQDPGAAAGASLVVNRKLASWCVARKSIS